MKFNGQPLRNSSQSIFELRRVNAEPLALRLQPLSLGFHQRLRARGIVLPVAPLKVARDSSGKPMRDAQGMAVTLPDRQNTDYLAAVEEYHRCVATLSVVEALEGDSQISFDAVAPVVDSKESWTTYSAALFQEMEQAGFTAGDLILLCREICRLSNLIDDHLSDARRNFSPPLPDLRD